MKRIDYLEIILIVVLGLLFRLYILNFLPINSILAEPILITDLFGNGKSFHWLATLIFGLINIFLLWIISYNLFGKKISFINSLLYSISPWSVYLDVSGSSYIFLLFCLLISLLGLQLIYKAKNISGQMLAITGCSLLLYSNFLMWIVVPILLVTITKVRIISFDRIKIILIAVIIICLPIPYLMIRNVTGVKNIFNNQIKIFEDVGLLNMVNSYRGAAEQDGLGFLAKLSENRYIFSMEYILLKFTKHFIPSTYFTQQEKLLGFSFSPPVYLGFFIPFVFGLYQLLQTTLFRKALLTSSLLVIPSLLAKQTVDLNRLIIFAPVVTLIISYGFIRLYEHRKNKRVYIFLVLTIFIVLFQLLTTVSDIQSREKTRFKKFYEQSYEIGKQ